MANYKNNKFLGQKNNRKSSYKYELSEKGAINPYTFVRLSEKNADKKDVEEVYKNKELLTGVLHCKLVTKTPIIIPDTENVKIMEFEVEDKKGNKKKVRHKEYSFYSETNEGKKNYAIPGSSIRGVLRSVYETATESCFSTLRPDTNLTKRVEATNPYKPGILVKDANGDLQLFSAEMYKINTLANDVKIVVKDDIRYLKYANKYYKTGDVLQFDGEKIGRQNKVTKLLSGSKKGYLYVGEKIRNKKNEAIFVKGDKPLELDKKELKYAYNRFENVRQEYQNKGINKDFESGHTGYKSYEVINLSKGMPIWYDVSGNKINLSYACIGRIAYENTLNDFVGDRCTNRNNLCEACLLFGMVGDDASVLGLGSRVRVSTAFASNNVTTKKLTLKELGMPRYTYLPFYAIWQNNDTGYPFGYDAENMIIAGRKFYWHNNKFNENDATAEKNNLNATMEIAPEGSEFLFDVYYDQISEEQLQKLLWVITVGDNKLDSNMCHKIGHGKPLGFGSVKIVVESVEEREFNDESYRVEKVDNLEDIQHKMGEPFDEKNTCIKGLNKVLNFEEPYVSGINDTYKIDYPNLLNKADEPITQKEKVQLGENTVARHQWYRRNKNEKKFAQVLPKIDDENQMIKWYKVSKEEQGKR